MLENNNKSSTRLFQDVLSTFPLDKRLKIDLFKMLKLPRTDIKNLEVSQYSFLKKLLQIESRPDPKLFDSYAIHPQDLKEVMDNMKFYITSTKMGVPFIVAESKYTTPSGMEVPKRYCILSKGTKTPEGYNAIFLDTLFKDAFENRPSDEMLLYMAKDIKRRIEFFKTNDIEVPYSYWKFIENATKKFKINPDGKTSRDNIRSRSILYTISKKDGTTENRSFSSMELLDFYLKEKNKNNNSFIPPIYDMPKKWLNKISPVIGEGRQSGEEENKVTVRIKEDTKGIDRKQFIWEYQDFLRNLHPRMSTFIGKRDNENIKVYIFPNETFGNIIFIENDRFKGDKRGKRTYILFGEDYDSILQQDIGEIITSTHKKIQNGKCFGIRINHDKDGKEWKNKVRWLVEGDYLAKNPFSGKNRRILEEQIALRKNKGNRSYPEVPSFDE